MTPSSSSPTTPQWLPPERYRIIANIREDALGRVYRAEDIKSIEDTKSTTQKSATVTLIELKRLLARLPSETQARLREAANEAQKIDVPTLLHVREFDLDKLYMVTDWVEGVPLAQWLQPGGQQQTTGATINLVATMARAADFPFQKQFKWVRPSLEPDRIWVKSDASALGDLPVLVDLGFAELLPNIASIVARTAADAAGEARKLGILLVSMLLGDLTHRNDN